MKLTKDDMKFIGEVKDYYNLNFDVKVNEETKEEEIIPYTSTMEDRIKAIINFRKVSFSNTNGELYIPSDHYICKDCGYMFRRPQSVKFDDAPKRKCNCPKCMGNNLIYRHTSVSLNQIFIGL